MSWRATSWASDQVTGSPITKSVLWKLADNANDEGICWPSLDTIATHTELSRRTVQEHLNRLEALGLITIEKREAESGASLSNRYHLNMPAPAARPGRGEGAPPAPRGAARAPGDAPPRTPGMQLPAPPNEPSNEPPLNRHSLAPAGAGEGDGKFQFGKGYPERFDEFRDTWAKEMPGGFPAKDEAAARIAFTRLSKSAEPDTLIACVKLHGQAETRRKNSRRGGGDDFRTKLPSTWLNSGGWEGYLREASAAAERAAGETEALARVAAGLGAAAVEVLRCRHLSDAALAILDGVSFHAGPPPTITAVNNLQRSLLDRHLFALERHLGEGLRIVQQPKAAIG